MQVHRELIANGASIELANAGCGEPVQPTAELPSAPAAASGLFRRRIFWNMMDRRT